MKGGVLGIIVVCVILGMSILLVSVLDVQEETKEVTKYNYVTDTTSLFDFDKTPQYMDYDMVLNYTGYYTQDSQPYWGGVDYETEATVSRYVLNLAPTDAVSLTENLRNSTLPNDISLTLYTFMGTGNLDYMYDLTGVGLRVISLADYISEISLNGYDEITFSLVSDDVSDTVLFFTKADLLEPVSGSFRGNFTLQEYAEYHPDMYGSPVLVAPLSATYKVTTDLVNLYSTPTPSDGSLLRSVLLSDTLVAFSTTSSTSPNPYGYSLNVDGIDYPPNEYLNIKVGVSVLSIEE